MSRTSVICLCPVKNESWILKHFLDCASVFADHIIIGDHNSTDGSLEITREYDRVRVVPLNNPRFDAGHRRQVLLEAARQISGKRLIVTIDADEMLSANWPQSSEWALMREAERGTMFRMDWPYLLPGLEKAVMFAEDVAFVDDGSPYHAAQITERRVPEVGGRRVHLDDIKLLHYVNIDPERKLSKQRWYKCMELVELGTRPFAICAKYPNSVLEDYGLPIVAVPAEWLNGYAWLDAYRSFQNDRNRSYWWDEKVLDYFDEYGTAKFRKVNLWDVDWTAKAASLGRSGCYRDPRRLFEVLVHRFTETYWSQLKAGQASQTIGSWLTYKLARVGLRSLGW